MSEAAPPSLGWSREDDGSIVLSPGGTWRISESAALQREVEAIQPSSAHAVVIDGSALGSLDTFAAFTLLAFVRRVGVARDAVAFRKMQDRHRNLLALVIANLDASGPPPPPRRVGFVPRVGAAAISVYRMLLAHSGFFGEVFVELVRLARHPGTFRFKEAVSQFESTVVDAIPIVALVTLMIGIVFAYLLGVQAQRYGATIFVVDGVGMAMTRELSPIIVAVIVAGRSGAAFTAQIGLMKVQEETDAIRVLGLSPIQVLVVPRLAAIVLGLPLLVYVGDLAGIVGGAAIAAAQLGIPTSTFATRLHSVLDSTNVIVGLGKAPVFGLFIGNVACRMGLSVSRDARSVGEHTTSTVVQSIVWVILLDAAFAVVLQRLGI
jgi:phospholipid/cholesterol/gamma-HCH transport system permease protein